MTGLKLMAHQRSELDFLLNTPRALLLSETGTGKTPTLLMYAAWALKRGHSVLWLTQAGLTHQLFDEAEKWIDPHLPSPMRIPNSKRMGQFMVASHQWAARNRERLPAGWLLIVDEADAAGVGGTEPKSPVFQSLRLARELSTRSVFATATPVASTHGLDLHALLEAAGCAGLWPRNKFAEHIKYFDVANARGGFTRVPSTLRARGVQHLKESLAGMAAATRTSDLGIPLPRIVREDVIVELGSDVLSNYAAIRQQTTGLHRHQQSLKAIKNDDLLSRMAVDVLDGALNAGESHFVVFAEQLELVDSLVRELDQRTYPTWTITGRERPEQRARSMQQHQDSHFGVLVGTKAIEAGLNLQYCSLLVSVDASWSYRREMQREGRICRTGSPFEQVRHVRLLRNVDLERHRMKRVESKQGLHEEVMNAVQRSDTVCLTRPA